MQLVFIEKSKTFRNLGLSIYLTVYLFTCNQFAVVPYHFLNFQILEDGQLDRLDPPLCAVAQ